MLFSSLEFLFAYLILTTAVYFLTPPRARNIALLLTSLAFYGWGEPIYVFLMIATIAVDHLAGLAIARCHQKGNLRAKKATLIAAIAFNIGLLAFFKYADFVLDNLRLIPALASLPVLNITLPIGISFYTFQALSYVIDVNRGDVAAQKNPATFGAYVTLFPQLIAGPIVRYTDVERELHSRTHRMDDIHAGTRIFLCGLAKKVLLANSAGAVWEYFRDTPVAQQSALGAWLGLIFFTFQMYFDFSGYSDMAIGLGRIFGFHFNENFNYPFIARTVSDYWRRWHMTLTSWFRAYVYIPLGGNRRGTGRTYLNMLIVWLLTGLWHGAAWNFILWGLFFFVVLALERAFLGKLLQRLPAPVGHVWTLAVAVFSFYLFVFDGSQATLDLSHALAYGSAMFGGAPLATGALWYELSRNAVLLIALILAATPLPKKLWARLRDRTPAISETAAIVLSLAALVLCTAYLVDSSYNPFLYFRF